MRPLYERYRQVKKMLSAPRETHTTTDTPRHKVMHPVCTMYMYMYIYIIHVHDIVYACKHITIGTALTDTVKICIYNDIHVFVYNIQERSNNQQSTAENTGNVVLHLYIWVEGFIFLLLSRDITIPPNI